MLSRMCRSLLCTRTPLICLGSKALGRAGMFALPKKVPFDITVLHEVRLFCLHNCCFCLMLSCDRSICFDILVEPNPKAEDQKRCIRFDLSKRWVFRLHSGRKTHSSQSWLGSPKTAGWWTSRGVPLVLLLPNSNWKASHKHDDFCVSDFVSFCVHGWCVHWFYMYTEIFWTKRVSASLELGLGEGFMRMASSVVEELLAPSEKRRLNVLFEGGGDGGERGHTFWICTTYTPFEFAQHTPHVLGSTDSTVWMPRKLGCLHIQLTRILHCFFQFLRSLFTLYFLCGQRRKFLLFLTRPTQAF